MPIARPLPAIAALALLAAACTTVRDDSAATSPSPADGTLAVPADYRAWPVFLTGVERPDAKQVRDIYVNPAGSKAVAGQPWPAGSLLVMELHKAKEAPDGSLVRDASGKLVKAGLIKVFVMGKGEGWGDSVMPAELRNGDWIYAAWQPDLKTAAADPLQGCRGCHLPQAGNDYVHRAGEYFSGRGR